MFGLRNAILWEEDENKTILWKEGKRRWCATFGFFNTGHAENVSTANISCIAAAQSRSSARGKKVSDFDSFLYGLHGVGISPIDFFRQAAYSNWIA